jgi:hypothetical protein
MDDDNKGIIDMDGTCFHRALMIAGSAVRMWKHHPDLLPSIFSMDLSHTSSRINLRDILKEPSSDDDITDDEFEQSSATATSRLTSTPLMTSTAVSLSTISISTSTSTTATAPTLRREPRRGRPRRCSIDNGRFCVIVGRTYTKETYLIASTQRRLIIVHGFCNMLYHIWRICSHAKT